MFPPEIDIWKAEVAQQTLDYFPSFAEPIQELFCLKHAYCRRSDAETWTDSVCLIW